MPWPEQTKCSQGTPLKLTQGDSCPNKYRWVRTWRKASPLTYGFCCCYKKVAMTFRPQKGTHFKKGNRLKKQQFSGRRVFLGGDWGETLPPRMPVATSYWQGKTPGTLWWPGCFGWSEKALFWRVNPSNIEVIWALGIIYIYTYILYMSVVIFV